MKPIKPTVTIVVCAAMIGCTTTYQVTPVEIARNDNTRNVHVYTTSNEHYWFLSGSYEISKGAFYGKGQRIRDATAQQPEEFEGTLQLIEIRTIETEPEFSLIKTSFLAIGGVGLYYSLGAIALSGRSNGGR